jgi:predicted transposase/invertase (TIGR01784 family)
MELVVKVIDIRYNKDSEILEKCPILNEYSRFVYLIETNLKHMPLEDAISKAVLQCHKEGILTDFLEKYGLEALSMEYRIVTQEEYGDLREQDGIEYGIEIGEKRGIEIGEQRGIGTVAAKMKAKGMPIEIIKETTGLDDAAIEKL